LLALAACVAVNALAGDKPGIEVEVTPEMMGAGIVSSGAVCRRSRR
jgi:hypothetical protein